ncbi:glycosyltransferase family 2 protein [Lactococcus lactis]|uniref:glycosyltransferase family 2 protein n=1 Tax=Lactococcus lactis TaxID=1358 RepID=UPI00398EC4E2
MSKEINIVSIIVTFNRKQLLLEAVKAMMNQTLRPSKIVIIDNDSTDGTFEELVKNNMLLEDLIIYKKLDKNIGGAGGFSEGVKFAMENLNFDWISLSDDDAIYDLKYFENLFNDESKLKGYGALCGKVQFPDGEVQVEQRRILVNHSTLISKPASPELESEIDLASFCGLVVNRKIVENIGLPRADFFIWMDDTEYSLRIIKESKIFYNPSSYITHKTSKSTGEGTQKLSWKNYYGYRNSLVTGWNHTDSKLSFLLINLKNYSKIIFGKLRRGDKHSANVVFNSMVDAILGNMGISNKYHP